MKLKNKSGFTLIEMVASIAIIVMITGIFIANYHTMNKRSDLIMAAQKLVADLHEAQSDSLGLIKYDNAVPAGGWGVHFSTNSPNQYVLFADLNAPGALGYMGYDSNEHDTSKGAKITDLPYNIALSALRVNGVTKPEVNVTFLPPNPQTNIYDGVATSTELEIDLLEKRNNTVKTIVINFLGLIEVK